jgi:hypothetical protein
LTASTVASNPGVRGQQHLPGGNGARILLQLHQERDAVFARQDMVADDQPQLAFGQDEFLDGAAGLVDGGGGFDGKTRSNGARSRITASSTSGSSSTQRM